MTELRSLLLEAEPLDDAGFLTATGVRATAARRTRHRYVVVATALAALLLLVPLVLRPSDHALQPVAPSPSPTPSATPLLADLVGTQWWVDLRASGITDDPEVVPTSVPSGSGALGLGAVVLLGRDGALSLRNGYVAAGPVPAGGWSSPGPGADANRGSITFDVTAPLSTWDSPLCTRESCRPGSLPYWPGVEAFSRLGSVVAYELQPVPAGEPMPRKPTIGMSLIDARGNVVLCLFLLTQDGAPNQF